MKIVCVGWNYPKHNQELNSQKPAEPVIFIKPETALTYAKCYKIPCFTRDLHYEAEIVLKINRFGHNIAVEDAESYFDCIALGIDFTARDIQRKMMAQSLPWEKAKAFNDSALVSQFMDKSVFADLNNLNFSLKQNGKVVQNGNTKDMIFDFKTLIADISKYFSLDRGDMIFTGTPAGVGKITEKDHYEGFIEKEQVLNFEICE